MDEERDEATARGQLSVDQLQQELHAKELLLEALRCENARLKEDHDHHQAKPQDWKGFDTLKRKILEYQSALEQRDLMLGQMEAGINQLMHKNAEAEAKGRKDEEHYSGEIQSLAQQVQELTAQLTLTSHQHHTSMRAAEEAYNHKLTTIKHQLREQHEGELVVLKEQHASEVATVSQQLAALQRIQQEDFSQANLLNTSLRTQLEEEKGRAVSLQREKEACQQHLGLLMEEKESLRRSCEEEARAKEDLVERLREYMERHIKDQGLVESLQRMAEVEAERRAGAEARLEEEVQTVRNLSGQKTAVEVKLEHLTLQLQVVEEELAQTSASREGSLRELEATRGRLQDISRKEEALTKVNGALNAERDTMLKEYEALTTEKDMLAKEKEELFKEKNLLCKENEFLTKEKDTLLQEKETLIANTETLNKEKDILLKEKNTWAAEKEALVIETDAWATEKEDLLTEKETLLTEKKNFTTEKVTWVKEKEELNKQNAALLMQQKALIKEKETWTKDNEDLIKQTEKLMTEKTAWTKDLGILSRQKETLLTEKNELTTVKEELLKQTQTLATENVKLVKEKEDLITQIANWATESEVQIKQKNSLLTEKESLTKEKECLTKEKDDFQVQLIALDTEKEALAKQNQILLSDIKTLIKERECWVKEKEDLSTEKETLSQEKQRLAAELDQCTGVLTEEVAKCEQDSVLRVELEREVYSLRRQLEEGQVSREELQEKFDLKEAEVQGLLKRCTETITLHESNIKELEEYKKKLSQKELQLCELENYKESCSLREMELRQLEEAYMEKLSLKENELREQMEKLSLKDKELRHLQEEYKGMDELRESCCTLLDHLQRGEKGRRKVEEDCEDKCEVLNSVLRSLDLKLCEAASLLTQGGAGARGVLGRLQEAEEGGTHLKQVLRETKEKEALTTKLRGREASFTCLEGDKRETEKERDEMESKGSERKVLEEKITLLQKDKEKLLDEKKNMEVEREKLVSELDQLKAKAKDGKAIGDKGTLEDGGKDRRALEERLTVLEKEKKELTNEIERMCNKVHDQHFTITSLQNEKSRMGRHIAQLEGERATLRAIQDCHLKDNLDIQGELSSLRIKVQSMEEKLALQEQEMCCLHQALTALTQADLHSPGKLKEIVKNINCAPLRSGCVSSPRWMSKQCEDLWEDQRTSLGQLVNLQQRTDRLQQEKLETDLENISLSTELQRLRQSKEHAEAKESEQQAGVTEEAGTGVVTAEMETLRQENRTLKQCVDRNNLLLRLERLQVLRPKPRFERELGLCLREREAVLESVRASLQQLMTQWRQEAESHPTLASFMETLEFCIEDMRGHCPDPSSGGETSVEAAVRCLQEAVIKGVSGQYREAVTTTLATLQQDLSLTLHQATLPPLPQDASLPQDTSLLQDPSLQDLTERVEQLINVRTALVDAANEFDEQLEEVLGQRVAYLTNQLQTVLKVGGGDSQDGVGQGEGEGGAANLALTSPSPPPPQHQAFVQEFSDFTSRVNQEAHTEKLQVLRSQQMMVHKILEDNQAKLNTVCQAFLGGLQSVNSLEEAVGQGQVLVGNLRSMLAEEVAWVEQQYRDLLEQYTHEQDTYNHANTLTCTHLTRTLTRLLRHTQAEPAFNELNEEERVEVEQLKEEQRGEMEQLREEHRVEVQRLEAQLAARDQEALQHLQGLYNDRDWYKKTVGLLSHVTLQLLHYYSVAQSLTHGPQPDPPAPTPHLPESPAPGRVLDLSFLSDCVGDDEELQAFSEDRVLATGLMGRTVLGEEGEVEDTESALDGTAISEGMMEDLDKDEQVRSLLERSYPQLMAILKGRWDRVLVARLEREVQELTISLQASAGMLRIFIHSVSGDKEELTSHTLVEEEVDGDSVRDSACEVSHSEASQESQEQRKDLCVPQEGGVRQFPAKGETTALTSQHLSQQEISTLSQTLIHRLTQDETLANFTMLQPHHLQDPEKLYTLLKQLCDSAQATEKLKLELHHTHGLQLGLEEEKSMLQEEITRLTHYSKTLAGEVQVLRDQLEEEEGQEGRRPASQYAAKMEATKDVRERVRAALSAKNTSLLERGELEARVAELEGVLEAVVRESDAALEALRARGTDLSQQLEVADRQLRSARQFLDEQASERDQELEELVAARDKLSLQLREKEAQLTLHATQEREVENLEQLLREKSEELEEAQASKEELQVEHKAAKDKIWDLREIIQSLESQVDARCVREGELSGQVEALSAALTQAQQQAQHLSSQVEELRLGGGEEGRGRRVEEEANLGLTLREVEVEEEEEEVVVPLPCTSLQAELEEGEAADTVAMLNMIEKRLGDTTRGLEVLQLSGSLDDLSSQEVEVAVVGAEGRLSPATVDQRLEDQLQALERTTEAAAKRNRDLHLMMKNLRADYEEVSAERDVLQERSREQLVQISGLEARLDELRRADHPAAAQLRQRLTQLQEELDGKRAELTSRGREVEELKHTLSNIRAKLTSREDELERLQNVTASSTSQPHSLPQTSLDHLTASHAHLQDQLDNKTHLIETLKKELIDASQPSSLPSSLVQGLIEEKNAEISELSRKLRTVVSAVQQALALIKEGGSTTEAQRVLVGALGWELHEGLGESEAPEVLRRSVEEPEGVLPSLRCGGKGMAAVALESPMTVSSGRSEESSHTQPSAANLSLLSTHTAPPSDLSQVSHRTEEELPPLPSGTPSQATHYLPASQARLEEDYRGAQELLEAREAEILQLSEEVEDAPPQPLPAPHLFHHQPSTDQRVEELEAELLEVTTGRRECEAQLESLTLQTQVYQEEVQQLRGSEETLRQEVQQTASCLEEREAALQDLRRQLKENSGQWQQQQLEMHNKLKAAQEQVEQLTATLQRKDEEVKQLSSQLEQVHVDIKERLLQTNRETERLEQQFQQEITALKERHITREKELCSDYEERMAEQVGDLAVRLGKDKEAAMARQQEVFEAALHQANQERERAVRELEQHCTASAPPQPLSPPPPPQPHQADQQTVAQLCAAVDALTSDIRQELDKSGQLDLSLASLVRSGACGEASTRASSVLSDASEGEEHSSVASKIQRLMTKVHEEGIQMLTLIELMFLHQHQTHLDSSQRSIISSSRLERGVSAEEPSPQSRALRSDHTQLLCQLAALEEELTKKDQEMKRKVGLLEFRLEQVKMSGCEWKLSFESEKQQTRDLMDQLRKERLAGADHVSELTLQRTQLFLLRLQLQKVQEENCTLSESQEKNSKQIEGLQTTLQTERDNFSRVSKVLSEERKVTSLTLSQHDTIIKDLRKTLEKERERIMDLYTQLAEATNQHSRHPLTTATTTTTTTRSHSSLKKPDASSALVEELQMQLAVERERCGELERACERERLKEVSQREQAIAERARAKVEVREAEGRLAELTRTVRSLETEKERLMRQMSHDKERLQHQESRIRELEGEVRRLEGELRAQSEAHQAVSQRVREEGAQLHLSYTRTLTKLGEAEGEVCELRHKVKTAGKELQLAKEREVQLQQELHTERTAINRLGLPALSRMINFDEYVDLHLKENLELCKSVLRLTDDRQAMRAQISQLEETVASLTQQLVQAQAAGERSATLEEVLAAERLVWEAEKASLQRLVAQREAEVMGLRADGAPSNTQHNTPNISEVQQLYGRFLQSEHRRKALAWQKHYLLVVIKGYSDTERHTLARLTAMAPLPLFPPSTSPPPLHAPRRRFRVVAMVVVASCRMRSLVIRFHRKKQLHLQHLLTNLHTAPTTTSTPESSRPESSISVAGARVAAPPTPEDQGGAEGGWGSSFTGQTPPTRGPTSTSLRPHSASHRSLFQEDSERLNQYVERLDNIHSVLGLVHRKH